MNDFISFMEILMLFALLVFLTGFLIRYSNCYFKNILLRKISMVFILIIGLLTFISFIGFQVYQEKDILSKEESYYNINKYDEQKEFLYKSEKVFISGGIKKHSFVGGYSYSIDFKDIENRKELDEKDFSENANDYYLKEISYTIKKRYFPFSSMSRKTNVVEYYILKE